MTDTCGLDGSKLPVQYFSQPKGWMTGEILDKYSNINVIFLPPNTTSKLQPLDLGTIQNFKVHYRKLFLCFVISKIDECDTASEVIKSVNILQAIRWVAQAWEAVSKDTLSKCFQESGYHGCHS